VPEAPRIYSDADVYLDLVTRNKELNKGNGEPRWKSAQILFEGIAAGRATMVASALSEAEVLLNGKTQERRARSQRVDEKLRTWFSSPSTIWVDIDRFLVRDAERLRVEYGPLRVGSRPFGPRDGLHFAAALRAKCDYFMTHDEGFPIGQVIEGMQVVRPHVVWQEMLFDEDGLPNL
jgi:predicted nucleic acid-binding protein